MFVYIRHHEGVLKELNGLSSHIAKISHHQSTVIIEGNTYDENAHAQHSLDEARTPIFQAGLHTEVRSVQGSKGAVEQWTRLGPMCRRIIKWKNGRAGQSP